MINFLEMLCETTHSGMIDKKIIKQWWGYAAVIWWEAIKEIQLAYREINFPDASIHLE